MGSQQILLYIITVIIIGIGTIVGLTTFSEQSESSNMDAVRHDMIIAFNDSQAYVAKPAELGGGGGSFSNISFDDLSLDTLNENASYEITQQAQNEFVIRAEPARSDEAIMITIYEDGFTWETDQGTSQKFTKGNGWGRKNNKNFDN